MARIGLPKGSGKLLKVREKSVKSQGILKWILSGNPDNDMLENDANDNNTILGVSLLSNSNVLDLAIAW